MPDIVNVLHLSDLHFGMEKTDKVPSTAVDQRNLTLREMIKTLKELEEPWRPHLVVITGDIGWKGNKKDYHKAIDWLTCDLFPALKLGPDKLVVCPGNHDIDKKEASWVKIPSSSSEADDMLNLEEFKYFSRPFEEFIAFCNDMRLPPLEIGSQSHHLTGKIDLLGLRFVILNSAWFCRGKGDQNKLWLGKPMLETMVVNEQLIKPENYDDPKSPVTLALFHHPYEEWLNKEEYRDYGNRQSTLKYLSIRSHIILTGHVHARPDKPHRRFSPAWTVTGGASYAGATYQNHFSILRINTRNRTFDRRVFEYDTGKYLWRKEEGDTYAPFYDLKTPKQGSAHRHLIIPEKYREWVSDQCQDMDITKLAEATPVIQVRLPEIYIPLYANPLKKSDEKQEPVDIEDLIAGNRLLVIIGRAGSGKTTLAKHFAYMMFQTPGWKNLDGYLPVLVFLKDLKGFNASGMRGNSETAEKLLAFWAKNAESFLDVEVIRGFCDAGKVIFFLDGLDEIDESLRELIVTSFHSLKIKHENCKIILSGRPHGMGSVVTKWFGRPVEILPLLMNQVEAFIHKWFRFINESKQCGLKKTAEEMIGEVKSHPSIGELIDSPLMLTAICLLYNHNRALPGQRAELYDRFVTNLLHKRFPGEDQKVRNFLMNLAKEMHIKKRSKIIDRLDAIPILEKEYKRKPGETKKQYKDRMNEKFNLVEPGCGLLKSEQGGYGFIHLTFQEFLTANALVAGESGNHFQTIREYWEDGWHREVVQLYIGYLSIQSKGMANGIIQEILREKETNPFYCHLLAARAFIDIHRSNREENVTVPVVDKLWNIIDSDTKSPVRAEAGELLGRLGDERDFEAFIPIRDGIYETSTGKVKLKFFELAKFPVTNLWFGKFIADGGYKKPEWWSKQGWKWVENEKVEEPEYWHDHRWNCPNHPVVGVCWYEADAFCRWLTQTRQDDFTYRLPDEEEWEAAAVGKQMWRYPWGQNFDNDRSNTDESKIGKTSAVGIFKNGDTPDGLSDMVGNVWEWTRTFYKKDFFVLRGGSWSLNSNVARCTYRNYLHLFYRFDYVGFRCSRTK